MTDLDASQLSQVEPTVDRLKQGGVELLQKSLAERQKDAISECDRLLEHFKAQANRHKRRFKRLKQLSITLSLAVTLLSTLAASKKLGAWEWIVPVISSFAALSTTLLSQTNSQKTWVFSRNVEQKLQSEKFLYLQTAGSYSEVNEVEQLRYFSNRVMEIWSEGHETWGQTVAERKN